MDYDIFAEYYDLLTEDVDYPKRSEYLLKLFDKFDRRPSLLLDIGCGTGGFSVEFAKRGIEVIGVDPSDNMLNIAAVKAKKEGVDILFLNQSGEELDLYGTVDGAVSCLDTVNHITDKRTLQRFFNKISLFLEKERLFIFDVNTLYKHENILGNNTYVYDTEKVYCVWQNFFDKKTSTTDISLDFFYESEGAYQRSSEYFSERVYDKELLEKMLNRAGLKLLKVLGENSFSSPSKTSQRNIYITKKE
ncbi:MAG: class I SAM-dependent methyltransferase [Acutalibacteraceae bacterium]|nr:class I SAM-dependent methyltransferase [Acutalibacteraceae bacterium]